MSDKGKGCTLKTKICKYEVNYRRPEDLSNLHQETRTPSYLNDEYEPQPFPKPDILF